MEKQKFYMPASLLIKILVCLAVIAAFWVAPPVAPLTAVGMRVIGIFIGVILMLSIVDTVWPAMLAIVLLGQSGVCTVNEAIAGSIGNWIIYFVLMSFIMTHALNESGFTDRLVAKFMSIKLVSKSPWIFTISLGVLGMLLGCFMDQVPAPPLCWRLSPASTKSWATPVGMPIPMWPTSSQCSASTSAEP